MSSVIKWNKSNLRKMEREMTKEMNKRVANINKNINPIILPSALPSELTSGITINNTNDNSIHITGDVHHSQISGSGNHQANEYEIKYIENVLQDIKSFSKTLNDDDRCELESILTELRDAGNVDQKHKSFLEKHPLIMAGVESLIAWVATYGLDKLTPILMSVFMEAVK